MLVTSRVIREVPPGMPLDELHVSRLTGLRCLVSPRVQPVSLPAQALLPLTQLRVLCLETFLLSPEHVEGPLRHCLRVLCVSIPPPPRHWCGVVCFI